MQEAVRAEEPLLDAAPSLEVDGPRVRAELDAGPTEQTAITANLIQESLIHGPALANFDRRNRNEDGNRSE
ncbi:MAG: hypothetical protein QOE89_242 [Pseudonocardiales bacterium]|nr:hypothetical protein [Pseudonocardiales bacterium]